MKEVIDLTKIDENDEDMAKALQLSLEEAQSSQSSNFKSSDRAPDPNWAMVPSNVSSSIYLAVAHRDLQSPIGPQLPTDASDIEMSRAVEASLKDAYQDDLLVELPPIDIIRKGARYVIVVRGNLQLSFVRPVALRPHSVGECWGYILLHALYYVPQVRAAMASLSFPDMEDVSDSRSKEARGSSLFIHTCESHDHQNSFECNNSSLS